MKARRFGAIKSGSQDPLLFLSLWNTEGQALASPLFAAINVSRALCERLRELSRLWSKHKLQLIRIEHEDVPIYWDTPPGTAMAELVIERSDWLVLGDHCLVVLVGRLPNPDGGMTACQELAYSWFIDVAELELWQKHQDAYGSLHFREQEGWEAQMGVGFCNAVFERLTALQQHRRREGVIREVVGELEEPEEPP